MNPARLLSLFPLAYIVFWFYAFIVYFMPLWNQTWEQLTMWTIVSSVLFLTGGLLLLIACFILLAAFLFA